MWSRNRSNEGGLSPSWTVGLQNKNNAYCIVRRRVSREDRDAGIRTAFIELSVHLDLSPTPPAIFS